MSNSIIVFSSWRIVQLMGKKATVRLAHRKRRFMFKFIWLLSYSCATVNNDWRMNLYAVHVVFLLSKVEVCHEALWKRLPFAKNTTSTCGHGRCGSLYSWGHFAENKSFNRDICEHRFYRQSQFEEGEWLRSMSMILYRYLFSWSSNCMKWLFIRVKRPLLIGDLCSIYRPWNDVCQNVRVEIEKKRLVLVAKVCSAILSVHENIQVRKGNWWSLTSRLRFFFSLK